MKKRIVQKYLTLSIGIILSAYSIVYILRPNGLMTGGITGISRMIEVGLADHFNLDPNLVFNLSYYTLALIILGLSFLFLGKAEAYRIVFMSLTFPIILIVFTYLDLPKFTIQFPIQGESGVVGYVNDLLLPALAYGVFSGLSTGFIVRSGFTSGGSDTIAKIIYKKLLPYLSIGSILMAVDGIIIFSSIFVFDLSVMAYAILTKYVSMKAVDLIVFGFGRKRVKIEILSNKIPEITDYIMNTIHRGVTLVESQGGYSHVHTQQIVCICTPRESLQVKNFIASIDAQAFVYIIPIISIWGSNFQNIRLDDLSE